MLLLHELGRAMVMAIFSRLPFVTGEINAYALGFLLHWGAFYLLENIKMSLECKQEANSVALHKKLD